MNHTFLSDDFTLACRDYAFLMDRHYPERTAVKLVGDHYRLTRDQRGVLYRGISSSERSRLRSSLLVSDVRGKELAIDGYNVLFTLLNYRLGRFTFICTDQILRDAGSLHGKLRDEATFKACAGLLADFLPLLEPGMVHVYFDSPVSHSERHAHEILAMLKDKQIQASCELTRSADYNLKNCPKAVLATSDTVIIESARQPVTDLPRMILEHFYQADFISISRLLSSTVSE